LKKVALHFASFENGFEVDEMNGKESKMWVTAQLGHRQYFAIPRGLKNRNLLHRMITDIWFPSWLKNVPNTHWKPFERFKGRNNELLNPLVKNYNIEAFLARAIYYRKYKSAQVYWAHLKYGEWFSKKIANYLKTCEIPLHGFFCFNTTALDAIPQAKKLGAFTVVDQIDPGKEEWEMVQEEKKKFPWGNQQVAVPKEYWERQWAEWDLADMILVNSNWSKKALLNRKVDEKKIAVVPIAYENPVVRKKIINERGRLQVLWFGTVNLRKGIQYLLPAAKQLSNVDFHIVGALEISREAVNNAPPNVRFYGQIPTVHADEFYGMADVFILPTLSDGFAISQLEAMSWGLPVITTPNCGEVVKNGENGFVIPIRDSESIAKTLLTIDKDRILLGSLSGKAISTSKGYTVGSIVNRFLSEVDVRIKKKD